MSTPQDQQILFRLSHIQQAAISLSHLIVRGWLRPDSFWVLGPNFDSSFWYRLNGNESRLDLGKFLFYDKLGAKANSMGIPLYEHMSDLERRLLFVANYLARVKVMRDCGNLQCDKDAMATHPFALVVKHFPGYIGNHQEAGELKISILPITLSELLKWQTPFSDNFSLRIPANAVMMSHSYFPNAEKELRENVLFKLDNSRFWATSLCEAYPSTLSPYFVRGLLRLHFKFSGVVISDWACMGAIHHFVNNPKNFPRDMADFSPMSRLTICSVEAGLDFCLGYKSPDPQRIPDSVIKDVEAYCKNHPYWYELLDEAIAHSLQWIKDIAPPKKHWDPPRTTDLSLKEKLVWFYGFNCLSDLLLPVQYANTDNYEDVCSRGGILTALFRYYCLVAESSVPKLLEYDPCKFKTTEEWLLAINRCSEYHSAYSMVIWDTVFSQALDNNLSPEILESLLSAVLALPQAKKEPETPLF